MHLERSRLLELAATAVGRDAADQAERALREFDIEQVDLRIARVRERLDNVVARGANPVVAKHDGTVRPGEMVALDFGDGTPERYVVGNLAEVDEDVAAVTPSSPLGKALLGSAAGTTVSYRTPAGQRTVRIAAVGETAELGAVPALAG